MIDYYKRLGERNWCFLALYVRRHEVMKRKGLSKLAYLPEKRRRGRPRIKWKQSVKKVLGSLEKATTVTQNRPLYRAVVRDTTL